LAAIDYHLISMDTYTIIAGIGVEDNREKQRVEVKLIT
jgi:hypothetical protein